MRWVRSPAWDGFWLLSGLPIGVALMLFVPGIVIPLAVAIMVLETGHVVSPMILAWSKPGLRVIVCREWHKYIVAPASLMAGCLLLPWPAVFDGYFAWNIWHFGMQIFVVSCLYRLPGSPDERLLRALGCVIVAALGMAMLPLWGPKAY